MSLEIFLGPMFAGKSSTILRIENRYKSINYPICLISHSADNRYSVEDMLMNHDKMGVPCQKWATLMDHIHDDAYTKAKLVIVDEAQFFPDLVEFVKFTTDTSGKDMVLVGLDGDAERKPFGQVLDCIPLADNVTKLKSFCRECGDGTEAIFTKCTKVKDTQMCVGGSDMYVPVCRKHYLQNKN